MFSRTRKSSLFHRSLALVSGLLLVELSFVGFLVWQLNQERQNADQLRHSKAVVDVGERLLEIAIEGGDTFRRRFLGRNIAGAGELGPFVASLRETPQLLDQLEQLVADDAPRLEKVRDVHRRYNEMFDNIMTLRQRIAQAKQLPLGEALAEYNQIRTVLYGLGDSLNGAAVELFSICQADRKIQDQTVYLQNEYRSRLWVAIFAFAAFNILAAIAAAVIFTRGLTSRIAVLVANTNNLAKRAPLLPVIGGTDEIAYLDEQFHSMAGALVAAEKAEREALELKKEVMVMITHDLRSPLQGISGFFELAHAGVFHVSTENGQKLAIGARTACNRMISLINDVLDIEKINSGTFNLDLQPVSVESVFAEVQQIVQESADRSNVRLEFCATTVVIAADRQSLIRILVNLVINAIKFSPPGASVTAGVLSNESSRAEFVEFFVQDQGRGIPTDKVSAVFDRFQQVKASDASAKGGSGLGLAICKTLVELHQGTIGVESTEGHGSRFWFRIPNATTAKALSARVLGKQCDHPT